MTDRGLPIVDGAPACPFVAYEDDREARSTSPDQRHRCFAEVRPAQRAIAHQEAYCLSSAFPVCPTFQDWARREAAAARPGAPPMDEDADSESPGTPGTADARAARGPQRVWSAPPPWAITPPPPGSLWEESQEDEIDVVDAVDEDDLDDDDESDDEYEEVDPVDPVREVFGDEDAMERSARRRAERAERLGRHRAPIASEDRRPPAGQARPRPSREDDAPSWERPRRFEAYPAIRNRIGLPGIPRLGVIAVAIIAAGIGLFYLPTLLGVGGPDGNGTAASPSPSAAPSASSPGASIDPTPVPEPTPVVYIVQPGDTLSKIAARFGVSLPDLLTANAETIPDPNKITIGDRVIIPAAPPTEFVDPGASGSLPPP